MAMKAKAKRRALNVAMVVVALCVVVAGIMAVTGLKSPAPAEGAGAVTVVDKVGNVTIERSGVAYSLDEGAQLQDGDIIEVLAGSAAAIEVGGVGNVALAEDTEVAVSIAGDASDGSAGGSVGLSIVGGELFADVRDGSALAVSSDQGGVTCQQGTFAMSARSGSSTVQVLSGSVLPLDGSAAVQEGSSYSLLADASDANGSASTSLSIESLSDFVAQRAKELAATGQNLCFSEADLDALIADRENQRSAAAVAASGSLALSTGAGAGTSGTSGGSGGSSGAGGTSAATMTCTVEIRCDAILGNMGSLAPGKDAYVPANGVILATSTVQFSEGDTAFDILRAACSGAGIQLEYSYTPGYESYYVEGINNLYEFDCGSTSGWMYKVNGWFPNYGASNYQVKNGDSIVWCYTCSGAGADVGGGV